MRDTGSPTDKIFRGSKGLTGYCRRVQNSGPPPPSPPMRPRRTSGQRAFAMDLRSPGYLNDPQGNGYGGSPHWPFAKVRYLAEAYYRTKVDAAIRNLRYSAYWRRHATALRSRIRREQLPVRVRTYNARKYNRRR